MNADDERNAYHENLGHDYAAGLFDQPHRCLPNMPPCPDCQAREEMEDAAEYGGA